MKSAGTKVMECRGYDKKGAVQKDMVSPYYFKFTSEFNEKANATFNRAQ